MTAGVDFVPGMDPAAPCKTAGGELHWAELSFRCGLLLGAFLFLAEGQGEPWARSPLVLLGGLLLGGLTTMTMAFHWRVLGDWRRRTQQAMIVGLGLVLACAFAAALDPRLTGSALPGFLQRVVGEAVDRATGSVPFAQFFLGAFRGVVAFLVFAGAMLAMLATGGDTRRGGFAAVATLVLAASLFFYPAWETVLGVAFLAGFLASQWEYPVLAPDAVLARLSPAQWRFLQHLLKAGELSTGETRLYLEDNPRLYAELLDFGLVDYDGIARAVVPGARLVRGGGSETLAGAMQATRRTLLIALALLYVVLPDFIPGPIDDIVILMIAGGASFGWLRDLLLASKMRRPRRF